MSEHVMFLWWFDLFYCARELFEARRILTVTENILEGIEASWNLQDLSPRQAGAPVIFWRQRGCSTGVPFQHEDDQ